MKLNKFVWLGMVEGGNPPKRDAESKSPFTLHYHAPVRSIVADLSGRKYKTRTLTFLRVLRKPNSSWTFSC